MVGSGRCGGAATTSLEPVLQPRLEHGRGRGRDWSDLVRAEYPYLAAAIVVVLLVATIFLIRWTWRLMKLEAGDFRDWLTPPPAGTLTT
jgi:hypothetical protein